MALMLLFKKWAPHCFKWLDFKSSGGLRQWARQSLHPLKPLPIKYLRGFEAKLLPLSEDGCTNDHWCPLEIAKKQKRSSWKANRG